MSDVNSLFKKKKGKSKALDLKATSTTKKPPKTKAEKKQETADDDEWKSETKKAVVMTNGKAAEEFGKVYTNEEIVYEEDLDMSTKLDMDDTRKMLQDVIQRSAVVDSPEDAVKDTPAPPATVVEPVKPKSLEDRFANAFSSSSSYSSKYTARGGMSSQSAVPKKSLEEEYPTLGEAVAKAVPVPVKKAPKTVKAKEEETPEPTPEPTPETVFRAAQNEKVPVESPSELPKEVTPVTVTPVAAAPATVTAAVETAVNKEESSEKAAEPEPVAKKEGAKKKKKKGGAFEI